MAAKNYTEILALVNAGNQMGLSNTIKRDYGIPLDFTSVQPSFDDAVIYAAENTKAYVGQTIAVGGKLYIITDEVVGTHTVGEGESAKTYNNYLAEVGSKTEGDGNTIELDGQTLKLAGLTGLDNSKTYVPSLVNGKLIWAEPDTSTAEGQTQEINALKTRTASLEETVNGVPASEGVEAVKGLVEKVADNAQAIADETAARKAAIGVEASDGVEATGVYAKIADALQAAKDYADAQDTDTVYDDTAVKARIKAIEDDYLKEADKYDDTALVARVKAIEDDYLTEADKYDDTALAGRVTTAEGKIEALEAAVEAIDYVDADELANAIKDFATDSELEAGLALKADKTALEALQGTVDAFLTGTGTEAALDSLKELIAYIDEHDGADLTEMVATIEGIEKKLEGIDTTVAAHVAAAIDALKIGDYAKAADLTALAGRVEALEAKPFDTYATKTEVEAVDGKFASYTTTKALNDLLADKADVDSVVANDTFEQFKTTNDEAIEAARTGAVADVAAKGYAVATEVASTYATKQDLTDHSNTMATTLNAYAKAEDVEADLAKKIETATIEHTSEGVAEDVTVDGTTLKIVVDAYTKAETLAKINEVIDKVNDNSETAASVAADLAEYEEANDARVALIETKDSEQDTAIAAAKAQADKGVADAKTANDALVTVNSTLATHGDDIAAVKGRLTTLETAKGDHETRIASAEGKITSIDTTVKANSSAIGVLQGKDTELVAEDERLAGLISALQSDKADKSDTYTKKEVDDAVANAIADAELSTYAKVTDVEAIYKAGEGETPASGILAVEIERAKAAEKANADAITALIGDDAGKTIREIAAEETADIVAGADAKYDTLKEIADFIMNDETGAAAMANDIAALKTKVDTGDKTVATYVSDAIAAIPMATAEVAGLVKASEEITVAADGKLGIGKVSTDALVQGTDTLVLNGGGAK